MVSFDLLEVQGLASPSLLGIQSLVSLGHRSPPAYVRQGTAADELPRGSPTGPLRQGTSSERTLWAASRIAALSLGTPERGDWIEGFGTRPPKNINATKFSIFGKCVFL